MLLFGLSSLLIAIPLRSSSYEKQANTLFSSSIGHGVSHGVTASHLIRVTTILFMYCSIIILNCLFIRALGSGLGLYSGLFLISSITHFMEMILYVLGAIILLPIFFSNQEPPILEYSMILVFTTIGASFLISSANLVSMYLSIELQSFAVYILAAIYRNSESATSAGLKYFLLGALSSALILLGSSFIYAYTGLTNFEEIYALTVLPDNISDKIILGTFIVTVGFLFKVAAAPFHI